MNKKRFTVILISSLLLIAAAFGQEAVAEDAPAEIVPSPCLVNVPDTRNIECGYLIVPADKSDPASSKLRLPYILMHSRNPNPEPDPIVFTTGGPGYSSLDSIWGFANSPLSDDRDVIVFEQRGNLHADPPLLCDESIYWDERAGNTPCLDSFKEKNIDLSDYTTAKLAADIVDLRKALDYEQWNLYGTSYSTSLMQHVMEMDPAGVRSAFLQSVALPFESKFNHQADLVLRSLEVLFDDCAVDSECSEAYPDLEKHSSHHRILLAQVDDLADAWHEKGTPETLQDLRKFLQGWWTSHILKVDAGILQYTKGKEREILRALEIFR